jgi:hypothetical protein
MAEGDFLDDRRRANEDDYFRRKDRELVEKMRAAATADQARDDLSAKTGLTDPGLLGQLQELGFRPDTIVVLPLVPILQVAWAEGGVSPAERSLIVGLARTRGIAEGSAADRLLSEWLSRKPAPEIFARASRLIRAMLDSGAAPTDALGADDLIRSAETIADASGGLFGIGRVSAEERQVLSQIVAALKSKEAP